MVVMSVFVCVYGCVCVYLNMHHVKFIRQKSLKRMSSKMKTKKSDWWLMVVVVVKNKKELIENENKMNKKKKKS